MRKTRPCERRGRTPDLTGRHGSWDGSCTQQTPPTDELVSAELARVLDWITILELDHKRGPEDGVQRVFPRVG
jgi:hypothetical protein